jgi:hypothetical protein
LVTALYLLILALYCGTSCLNCCRLCLIVLDFLLWSIEPYTKFISSQTHGRIQLRFTDLKGDTLVVTRLMQLTQKAKNLEFKTKDSSLHRIDSNGQVGSLILVW